MIGIGNAQHQQKNGSHREAHGEGQIGFRAFHVYLDQFFFHRGHFPVERVGLVEERLEPRIVLDAGEAP